MEDLGLETDTKDTEVRDVIFFSIDLIHEDIDEQGSVIGTVIYSGGEWLSSPLSINEVDRLVSGASS